MATLSGIAGSVLVSQMDAMTTGSNGQRLTPGTRIITTLGATAFVVYDQACKVLLGENRRYTVHEQPDCAQPQDISFGAATSYAVLGGSRIASVDGTTVGVEAGVSPGQDVLGFPPGQVLDDAIHRNDEAAKSAQLDAAKAYAALGTQPCNAALPGQNLGGLQLPPGVYCFSSAAALLNGELLLDAEGNPNAVFIFQIGGNLTTAANSIVRVINTNDDGAAGTPRIGPSLCRVYWQVGGSASLGRDSRFLGSIVSTGDIVMANNVRMTGRAVTQSGAVIMDGDKVDNSLCVIAGGTPPPAGAAGSAAGAGGVSSLSAGAVTALGIGAIGIGIGIHESRQSKSPN